VLNEAEQVPCPRANAPFFVFGIRKQSNKTRSVVSNSSVSSETSKGRRRSNTPLLDCLEKNVLAGDTVERRRDDVPDEPADAAHRRADDRAHRSVRRNRRNDDLLQSNRTGRYDDYLGGRRRDPSLRLGLQPAGRKVGSCRVETDMTVCWAGLYWAEKGGGLEAQISDTQAGRIAAP